MKEINKLEDIEVNKYNNIIDLPHYEFKYHNRMSIYNRSFQFAPFSALTGYSDLIKETSRLTTDKRFLDDDMKELLNYKFKILEANIKTKPSVEISYFERDSKKNGGKYNNINCKVIKIDKIEKKVILSDKSYILFEDIIDIDGELFNNV